MRQLTLAWAAAWQARDVERYIGFYAPDFVARGARSNAEWAAGRRAVISRAGDITVTLEDLSVARIGPNTIEARFRQIYRSARGTLESGKSLVWRSAGGGWTIVQETVQRERSR